MENTFEIQINKIKNKFKDLKEKAMNDCKIDRTDLFDKHNTNLLIEWINIRYEWSKLLKNYEKTKNLKFRSLYEYYKTEFPIKLSTKEEYFLFIESDSNFIEINEIYTYTKEIVKYIDSILETLKSRSWEIKNIIDYEKFRNGII